MAYITIARTEATLCSALGRRKFTFTSDEESDGSRQFESGQARQCHKQLSSCRRFCVASYIST